ncbi:type 2 lantipeptide synthetase LanM family protein [Paenibacillus sp. ACRSA]|uniref:type 2 lanthipeptide synthetase LanM family protein n=1 Tax=Paenibacillus sp. ACRSA TaxID=2918211 RepID=UPI001EF6AAE1|nr:type 2 lanthipeptide synthetase LanM family protein [Paenibacillus sp. ACRSA]MCG7376892.1 type 2 lantipeptide synthetase LanM family protein [Paenibacillus sp. ACRSA]
MLNSLPNSEFRQKLIEAYGINADHDTLATGDWIKTIERIWSQPTETALFKDQDDRLFSSFMEPFLIFALKNLDAVLLELESLDVNRDLLEHHWCEELYSKLLNLSIRTLIQELHIARLSGLSNGETSENRYHNYNTVLLKDREYVESILFMYPVLAKLMTDETTKFIEYHTEILTHLHKDMDTLKKEMSIQSLVLERISTGVGDTHSKGRSVSVLYLGNGQRLIYKPRSLSIDIGFEKFTKWFNQWNNKMDFRTPKSIDCGSYGWQSYVQYMECTTEEEVKRYYYRYGGYVALLYILGSRDFHFENIIADGEYPILIDMETLFSNRIASDTSEVWRELFLHEMDRSVFSSMLIPFKRTPEEDSDTSGLGNWGDSNNEMIGEVLQLPYTDEMRLVSQKVKKKPANNKPRLKGELTGFHHYLSEIQTGFKDSYHTIYKHKNEIVGPHGPLHHFKNSKVRMIFRSTNEYGEFLKSSLHPDYLQKLDKRTQLFAHFQRNSVYTPYYAKVVPYEMECMLKQEIPVFTFDMDSDHITIETTESRIELRFPMTGISRVQDRLNCLGKQDFEKQLRYLTMSLTSSVKPQVIQTGNSPNCNAQVEDKVNLLRLAQKIGDELIEHAAWDREKQTVIWVDRKPVADEGHYIGILDPTLYDGSLGIVLFMAQLGKETGDSRYSNFAREALQTSVDMITIAQKNNISVFSGLLGYAYTLLQLASIWEDATYYEEALKYIDQIKELIQKDQQFDIVGGSAGVIILLARLVAQTSDPRFKMLAIECGEHLLRGVKDLLVSKQGLLNGLSHGLSGFAWAFTELWFITSEEEYRSFAQTLIELERADYSKDHNNWRDKRFKETQEFLSVYWCHGSPGIGLSRLYMAEKVDDPRLVDELEAARTKIITDGLQLPPFLCHGSLGNIDILLSIEKAISTPPDYKSLQELGVEICLKYNSISARDFQLGLMTGVAGLGYGLLRLNNPEIPSVLSLEIPVLGAFTGA